VILLITILLLCSLAVCAADIEIKPYVDFDNSVIKVELTTEARYNQALSVVLYHGNEMGDDLSKIIKIADITADEDGKAYLEMNLSDDIPSGEYVISVYGGGSIANKGSKVIGYKNKADLDEIIRNINNASSSTVKAEVEKYGEIFDLPDNDAVYGQFILLKRDDYNSAFTSVNDIAKGLKNAKFLYEINNISSKEDLLSYLKENADELGIDPDDSDFLSVPDAFAVNFIKLKKDKALTGYNSFKDMYNKALAIALINSSNVKAMTSVIKKYADIIGISKDDYEANCSKYTATEINKAFHSKNFENSDAIVSAYKSRINELSGKTDEYSGSGSAGGNGRKSDASSSGSFIYVSPVDESSVFTDFPDLQEAAWAAYSIKKLAKKGIVNGYEDKSFRPNNRVTREEFITIVVRAFNAYKEDARCRFKDISEADWSYHYIASAAEKKYISGFADGTFGKASYITRQDAAAILYRVRLTNSKQFSNDETAFTDNESIADYSKEAIAGLKNAGIISGFEDGSFKPHDPLTRAQAAKMIDILMDL